MFGLPAVAIAGPFGTPDGPYASHLTDVARRAQIPDSIPVAGLTHPLKMVLHPFLEGLRELGCDPFLSCPMGDGGVGCQQGNLFGGIGVGGQLHHDPQEGFGRDTLTGEGGLEVPQGMEGASIGMSRGQGGPHGLPQGLSGTGLSTEGLHAFEDQIPGEGPAPEAGIHLGICEESKLGGQSVMEFS